LSVCTKPVTCPDHQILCGDLCRDVATDPQNCGGCSRTCPTNLPHCLAGICNP
jgi:hypothetical protein